MNEFKIDKENYQLNVEEHLRPSLERRLTGTTKTDTHIHSLPVPKKISLIKIAVLILRFYQKHRPPLIGNRCVFEPSCSHYSELAIRENGLKIGIWLTIKRLLRCRPGAGGFDLSCKKEKSCNTKSNQ